jgi:hypothetical protein
MNIDLSGITAEPTTSRAKHPTVEVDAETMKMLEQFAQLNPQFKSLKNQSETLGKQLAGRIKKVFFGTFAGVTPESSTMLVTAGGRTIKLTVKNAYSKTVTVKQYPLLVAAIGEELAKKHFHQVTVLKLELDKAPEDKAEAFANAVIKLAREMNVTQAVSASQCYQPVAGFHDARTTLLTDKQNVALDEVMPIVAYAQL